MRFCGGTCLRCSRIWLKTNLPFALRAEQFVSASTPDAEYACRRSFPSVLSAMSDSVFRPLAGAALSK